MKPLVERRRRSARERFQNCAYSYAAEYLFDVSSENDASRRGSCFHLAVDLYLTALRKTDQLSSPALAEMALSEAFAAVPVPWAERQDVESLWARWVPAFELPVDYYDNETNLYLERYSAIVRYDLVRVPDTRTLRIVDFKTWWNIPNDTALADSYQTHFYLSAARHLFPNFETYEMVYEHVRYGVSSEPIRLTWAEMDAFDESIREGDVAMTEAETTMTAPATGGAHCTTCMAVCPLVSPHRLSERLDTAEDVAKAIEQVAAMRRASGVLIGALKGYCAVHGPVETGGIEWAHRPVTKSRYPAADVLDTLSASGIADPITLTVSQSQVAPLLKSKKKYVSIAREIRALAISRTETVFEGKTVRLMDETATLVEEGS
jgi:hypothetical protein